MKKKTKKSNSKAAGKGKAKEERPYLSVVIPAYNENKLIKSSLETVTAYLDSRDYSYEVIVVDDGSSDDTVEIVRSYMKGAPSVRVLENGVNRGKGYSVRSGMLDARGENICFSDADLSTPIEDVEKLLGVIAQGVDIAIGSRNTAGSEIEVHQPWWRELMGKSFNFLVQSLAIKGIKDTQCGFKCFTSEAAADIFKIQSLDGFSFDVEALYIGRKYGYSIKEVPVKWVNRIESRVNPFIHPILMIIEIMKMRVWDLGGRYKRK